MSSDFRVGPWLVQPGVNTISRNGFTVRLEPKVMEVLVCLASQAGESVSKEVIFKTVWPDTFVSDDALIRSISELRRAFEDDAREPRIIETVPKRGYRLVAKVQPAEQAPPQPRAVRTANSPRAIKIGAFSVACLLLVAALTLGLNIRGLRDRIFARNSSPTIRSLAVLPLQNLSGDTEQDYFADGMTEELITELARSSTVRVISRTSVMHYKKSDKALPEIARELGVDAVIEGSVVRSGNRIRITVQLIYAPTDSHLWAQSYEREVKDVLALQDELAGAIAGQVRPELASPSVPKPAPPRVDPNAYEAYMKGSYYSARYTWTDLQRSRQYFEETIKLDPNFWGGYSGLGGVYVSAVGSDLIPDSMLKEAQSLEEKALQLDPTRDMPHVNMAWIKLWQWDVAGATGEAERAITLGPSDPDARVVYLWCLAVQGKLTSPPDWKQIRQLDPVSAPLLASLGTALNGAKIYDQALQVCQEAVDLEHDLSLAQWCLGKAYMGKQRPDLAVPEFRQAVASGIPYFQRDFAIAEIALGNRRDALDILAASKNKKDYFEAATLEAALGNDDAALDLLEKVYQTHGRKLIFASHDQAFDRLNSNPRFQDLLRRIGLKQ